MDRGLVGKLVCVYELCTMYVTGYDGFGSSFEKASGWMNVRACFRFCLGGLGFAEMTE